MAALPALFDVLDDATPEPATYTWAPSTVRAVNGLLARQHYLGPMRSASIVYAARDPRGRVGGAMIWRGPTSRHLPADTWLELSRWCLTPALGDNAGSQAHRAVVKHLRHALPHVTTLVSYSDPSAGHTGALYRACNWFWAPTWLRLRPPPSGQGEWTKGKPQAVKDRWVFPLRPDPQRADVLAVNDNAAIRAFLGTATEPELKRAARSLAPDLQAAAAAHLERSTHP